VEKLEEKKARRKLKISLGKFQEDTNDTLSGEPANYY
jgi:hypothetical protein